jgi:uncharacterized membrane protein
VVFVLLVWNIGTSGVLLLGFYFSGSKLTKVRANVKLQLDANYKVGGQRSAQQVRCAISTLQVFFSLSNKDAKCVCVWLYL